MTDFYDLCQRRQSCRNFSGKPVEHEKLVRCVEAARLAPSGCNSQPWSFVVAQSPQVVAGLAEASMQLGLNGYMGGPGGAKAFIVLLEEHAVLLPRLRAFLDSQYFAQGDLGRASAYLCLAAEDQGLGSCILGLFDREKVCALLGLPPTRRVALLVALGYPAGEERRPRVRKPLEELVRFL